MYMSNGKEALNLNVPLSSLQPLFSCRRQCCFLDAKFNGRVKPDTIPTAIFPTDPAILSETEAESACNASLMAS